MRAVWLMAGAAVLGLAGVSPAAAQTSAERCALIGPASERLACYDALFRSELAGGEGETGDGVSVGMWTGGLDVSSIDGTERPFASLQSQQLIAARPRGREPARMTVLCAGETTIVQFTFAGHPMGLETSNSGAITFQYDRMPPRSQSLPLSSDRSALGFFNSADAIAFLNQLAQHDTLYVRATPQGQRSATVSFALEGIEEALQPVRDACGW